MILDTETLPPLSTQDAMAPPESVIGLTILCHPDTARIGEQARLPRLLHTGTVELSRSAPLFCAPGSGETRPLLDPFISRRAITISKASSGDVVLDGAIDATHVNIDGYPATGPIDISADALDGGVVLELSRRVSLLLHRLGPPSEDGPEMGLVGASTAILHVKDAIQRVAQTDVPVLLSGESGTGKELVATAIHQLSRRADQPYYAINMAAVPATMAASELFGHARGAFTGATTSVEGYFSRADRGTLFLDEIGDTPLDVQAMLLRVLETGELQPIGSRQASRVDVRLIAAMESDLGRAVADGNIRLSFLQRLSGFQIEVPPLRHRRDDIGRLLLHFIAEELETFDALDRLKEPPSREVRPWLPAPLVSRLARHDWPGNIRQLRNVARQLVITGYASQTLKPDSTVEQILELDRIPEPTDDQEGLSNDGNLQHIKPVNKVGTITEEQLKEALIACDYQPAAAARRLGIGRTSVYKLLADAKSIRLVSDIPDSELRASHLEHEGDIDTMARTLEVSPRALKLRLTKLGIVKK